jgi:hypothetical protein
MGQEDELKKRLEALERENRELKKAAGRGTSQNKTIGFSTDDFKGHPTITFEFGGRRLTFGVRKAAVVVRCIDHIKRFVAEHNGEISDWDVVRGPHGEKTSASDEDQI